MEDTQHIFSDSAGRDPRQYGRCAKDHLPENQKIPLDFTKAVAEPNSTKWAKRLKRLMAFEKRKRGVPKLHNKLKIKTKVATEGDKRQREGPGHGTDERVQDKPIRGSPVPPLPSISGPTGGILCSPVEIPGSTLSREKEIQELRKMLMLKTTRNEPAPPGRSYTTGSSSRATSRSR